MKSSAPGKSTSAAEVLNISSQGLWLMAQGREYFLDYGDYPWFRDAAVSAVLKVRLIHGSHLHWPDLDADLELESLENPERYPLVYR